MTIHNITIKTQFFIILINKITLRIIDNSILRIINTIIFYITITFITTDHQTF